jgi:hypothetical protein
MNIEEELNSNRFREPGPFLETAAMAAVRRGLEASPASGRGRLLLRWVACGVPAIVVAIVAVDERITRNALESAGWSPPAAIQAAGQGQDDIVTEGERWMAFGIWNDLVLLADLNGAKNRYDNAAERPSHDL